MAKLRQYWVIILLTLVLLSMVFYWYEWRPSNIRQDCANRYSHPSDATTKEYERCLQQNGITK